MNTRVREIRQARGLTQYQLAEMTHVTPRTIISIEMGKYRPSLMLAYRLAVALGTSMEELYCLQENMEEEDRQREENARNVAPRQGALEDSVAVDADHSSVGLYGLDWRNRGW